jgi:hypothetical protein
VHSPDALCAIARASRPKDQLLLAALQVHAVGSEEMSNREEITIAIIMRFTILACVGRKNRT